MIKQDEFRIGMSCNFCGSTMNYEVETKILRSDRVFMKRYCVNCGQYFEKIGKISEWLDIDEYYPKDAD